MKLDEQTKAELKRELEKMLQKCDEKIAEAEKREREIKIAVNWKEAEDKEDKE